MPTCIHCRQHLRTEELDEHLRTDHGGSQNGVARTCISCPSPGNVYANLELHSQDVHGLKDSEDAKCGCGKTFKTRRKRNIHARDCDKSQILR